MKYKQLGQVNANDLTYFPFGSTNFKNCCKTVKLNSKYKKTLV